MSGLPPTLTAAAALGAYLLGSIPIGFLLAHSRGVDIRKVGSGNIGATNVFRSLGPAWGIATFAGDFLKGLLPVLLFPWLALRMASGLHADLLKIVCAFGAVAGHTWPCFLGFRGGKGIATGAGALAGIAPLALGSGLAVWGIVFGLSRYVSLASLAASFTVAAAVWALYARGRFGSPLTPVALSLMAVLAMWRHKSNIRRLLDGTEPRMGKRA